MLNYYDKKISHYYSLYIQILRGRDDLYKSSIVVLHDFSTVKCLFKAYAITYACRIVVLKSVFPEIRVTT